MAYGVEISSQLETLLRGSATRVAVLTGAGVSAESGVPTFRDKDGLWQKFKPEELASMDAFLRRPELVQEWYAHRREVLTRVQPNAGHVALAQWQRHWGGERLRLITQNVDGLHARAGSENVMEVHGNILRNYCVKCGAWVEGDHPPSVCPVLGCEGRIRPDVVWFGEMLPEDVWSGAVEATETCDLFLSVGTSAAVYPAAGLPLLARERGAYVVEINPHASEIATQVNECLRGPSAVVLPELVRRILDQT